MNGLNFEVTEDCVVQEFDVVVKAGSINDLASVPRWLWWLIPPHGNGKKASVVHDFLMRASAPLSQRDKAYADAVFYVLLTYDVKRWQAFGMFLAVVFFRKRF